MKFLKYIVLGFIILCSINNTSAIDYSFGDEDPTDIIYDVEGCFTGFDFVVAYAGNTDEISLVAPTGMGSQSLKVSNLPDDITAIAMLDGDIVAGFTTGDVIRFNIETGIFNYSTATSQNMQLLTQTPSAVNDIVIDSTGSVYVASDNYVYKLSPPYYSLSIIITDVQGIISLANHPDGLLYGTGKLGLVGGQDGSLLIYDGSTSTELFDTEDNTQFGMITGFIHGITSAANGDIYFNMGYINQLPNTYYGAYTRLVHLNYSDSYNAQSINYIDLGSSASYATADSRAWSQCYSEIAIEDTGTMFSVRTYTDIISTFSTIGLIGGYNGAITAASEQEYVQTEVNSLYSSYFNNTDIKTSYSVVTPVMNSSAQDYYKQTYAIQIELIDENDNYLDSYYIDGTEFAALDFTNPLYNYFQALLWDLLTDEYLYSAGNHDFSNSVNWANGTYTLKMYELNKYTGNRALLATDTLEVRNEIYTGSITTALNTDIPDTTTLPQKIDRLLSSGWFVFLLIIGALAGIAKKSDGGYSGTGLILVIPIAIIIAAVMGYIPVWVVFLMFFVVLLAILINKGGE